MGRYGHRWVGPTDGSTQHLFRHFYCLCSSLDHLTCSCRNVKARRTVKPSESSATSLTRLSNHLLQNPPLKEAKGVKSVSFKKFSCNRWEDPWKWLARISYRVGRVSQMWNVGQVDLCLVESGSASLPAVCMVRGVSRGDVSALVWSFFFVLVRNDYNTKICIPRKLFV